MREDYEPREQLRTLLTLELGARLWAEVEQWPPGERPNELTRASFFEYVLPYANALSWLRHLSAKEGELARVTLVERAFAREGNHDPESAELVAVQSALVPALVALGEALDLEKLNARELLSPSETEGRWSLDAKAAQFLEGQGLKEGAKWVRAEGNKRWKTYKAARELETQRSHLHASRSLWWLWENEELEKAHQPPVGLAHLCARALVKLHQARLDVVGWNQVSRLVSLHQSRHSKELSLAYCAREFVLCGLPYKPTKQNEFVRQNGNLRLRVFGDPELGVPYGQDRLIPIWLASAFQASGRPANNRIYFRSASDILRAFQIPINGHERQLLRERLQRVFRANYEVELKEKQKDGSVIWRARRYQLISEVRLWFQQKEGENQHTLGVTWQNFIELDPYFAQDLRLRSLPIDLDTVIALKRSPALLDFYAWQAWRSYRLFKNQEKEVRIPIFGPDGLWVQLGSQTTEPRKAKQLLRRWQAKLLQYWPQCPNTLTPNAEWILIRPAVTVPENAKLSLPGVRRKPPQPATQQTQKLLESIEPNAQEDNTSSPTDPEEIGEIHLTRPPGQDPFPDDE